MYKSYNFLVSWRKEGRVICKFTMFYRWYNVRYDQWLFKIKIIFGAFRLNEDLLQEVLRAKTKEGGTCKNDH